MDFKSQMPLEEPIKYMNYHFFFQVEFSLLYNSSNSPVLFFFLAFCSSDNRDNKKRGGDETPFWLKTYLFKLIKQFSLQLQLQVYWYLITFCLDNLWSMHWHFLNWVTPTTSAVYSFLQLAWREQCASSFKDPNKTYRMYI